MKGNRGLIVTGVVFAFVILLVLAANYIVLTDKNRIEGDYEKMAIDKTYNMYIDVNRIIDDVIEAELAEGTDCVQRADLINLMLDQTLFDGQLDEGPLEVDFTKTVTHECGSTDMITIDVHLDVNYVDTAYLVGTLVHKEGTYYAIVDGSSA